MARPRSFDEDQVIDRVTRTFWERGYANTSITDLEEATGLGRQSLYSAFGDKHALFLHALRHYATMGDRTLPESAFNADSPLEQVQCMLRNSIEFAASPGAPGACLMVQAMLEFGASDAAVQDCWQANNARIEQWFGKLVRKAATSGALAPGMSPTAVTTLLMAQHYAIPVMARAGVSARQMKAGLDLLMTQIRNPEHMPH